MSAEDPARLALDEKLGRLSARIGIIAGLIAGAFTIAGILIQGHQGEQGDQRRADAALEQTRQQAALDRAQLQRQHTYEQQREAYEGFLASVGDFSRATVLTLQELIEFRLSSGPDPTYRAVPAERLAFLHARIYRRYLDVVEATGPVSLVGSLGTADQAAELSRWALDVVTWLPRLRQAAGSADDRVYQNVLAAFLAEVRDEDQPMVNAGDEFLKIARRDLTGLEEPAGSG
jgi:hypothetical protein